MQDTAAWAIGRVYEHHVKAITPEQLQQMFRSLNPGEPPEAEGVLLRGLKDDPRVANNVCVALHNLAEQCEPSKDQVSNPLSPLVRFPPSNASVPPVNALAFHPRNPSIPNMWNMRGFGC